MFPDDWGVTADSDIQTIKKRSDLAKVVDCVCNKCGNFTEVKLWVAYKAGGCKIAAKVAAGIAGWRIHLP